ncbi:uncharacterized protein DFL_009917 [Arthrobotrys flagrans]|uniref:Uncharacterized protein n=1 Tax=Arthrobotrys flagrans TaxID=97331 RepID=A0A436ZSZ8_ARTFL|nr:hypothetical protein DFL_009917 [Arthrobotrys flagrans]
MGILLAWRFSPCYTKRFLPALRLVPQVILAKRNKGGFLVSQTAWILPSHFSSFPGLGIFPGSSRSSASRYSRNSKRPRASDATEGNSHWSEKISTSARSIRRQLFASLKTTIRFANVTFLPNPIFSPPAHVLDVVLKFSEGSLHSSFVLLVLKERISPVTKFEYFPESVFKEVDITEFTSGEDVLDTQQIHL